MTRQKLELSWIGKDQRPRLEPRNLLEDPTRSYHARQRFTENDLFNNRQIKGDNLLALKTSLSPPVTMRRNDRSHSPKYAAKSNV